MAIKLNRQQQEPPPPHPLVMELDSAQQKHDVSPHHKASGQLELADDARYLEFLNLIQFIPILDLVPGCMI